MDFSIPLVFLVLFIVACLILVFVYKFGMKEKSYEEALAEQRQHAQVLLGPKAKPKDKKPKKTSKKQIKEISKVKPSGSQEHESDEFENINNVNDNFPKAVEFKEEPEEAPAKEVVQVPVKPKRIKKVRPILIKKEKSHENVILDLVESPIVNNFEDNPPNDEFDLKRRNSKDELLKQETKDKNPKEKKPTSEVIPPMRTNKKQQKHLTNSSIVPNTNNLPIEKEKEKEAEGNTLEPVLALPLTNGIIGNPGKEKKKKKSEYNTMQQLTAERDGLINSVRKAELSKNEIQLIIDILLNKQLDAPAVIDEWSEGKSDPVQKLKKQLMEKEKALAEEKEACLGAQAKLKEVRAEQQSEKIQLQKKIRASDEVLQMKQIELQAANNRAQVSTEKIQQLQNELKNEGMKTRKYMEEVAALQRQIQQSNENDTVPTLRNNLEELSAQKQQLFMECQQILRDKDIQHQQFIVQMRELEKNLEQTSELNRQLKDSNDLLEEQISIERRAIQQHYEEKIQLERTLHRKSEELQEANNENLDSVNIIKQLKTDLKTLQDQLSQTNGAVEDNKGYEIKILNLTNELSSVNSELSSMKNQLQNTQKEYKIQLESYNKVQETLQKELEEQKVKNNELRTKNWKVIEALNAAEKRQKGSIDSQTNNNLASQMAAKEENAQKQLLLRLFPEVEELKSVSTEDWQEEYSKIIKNYINSLQNPVAKLQAQIQHYKNTINETESFLKKHQLHAEQEEIKWRNELSAKDAEIEQLKSSQITTLENNVASLERQLIQTLEEKQQLENEFQLFKSHNQRSHTSTNKYSDQTATIEQLSEEISRLREQLRVEESKNGDINICLKAQNNITNSRNGQSLIEGSDQ